MDLDGLVAEVDGQLRARVVPGRAEHEKAYLKSGLQHYGVPVPAIRAVAKGVRKLNPDLSHDELIHVVEALWNAPVHERRMVAVELLDAYADRLVPADMVLLERLLRESRTWRLLTGSRGQWSARLSSATRPLRRCSTGGRSTTTSGSAARRCWRCSNRYAGAGATSNGSASTPTRC